jgi:hypothetical protein
MDERILERRRFLQLFAIGSFTVPAVILAGCAEGARRARPPRVHGGNNGGEKSGGGGGAGAKGSR